MFCVPGTPSYVALWDSKSLHRHTCERVSYCVETYSSFKLRPQDSSPSLNLLSLFLSFIFCPTSFWREWAAFLHVWCPLPPFRSCFVEVAQHSTDLLMNLWERKWSTHTILNHLGTTSSLAFSMIQWMLAIWSLVPLPFLNASWISGISQFTYCWSLAWRILSITLLACEISEIVQ